MDTQKTVQAYAGDAEQWANRRGQGDSQQLGQWEEDETGIDHTCGYPQTNRELNPSQFN